MRPLRASGRSRAPRILAVAAAAACALLGAAWLTLSLHPEAQAVNTLTAMFSAFIPYGVLAWTSAALLFAVAGRSWVRAIAVPCLIAVAVTASWCRPYLPHASASAAGTPLRILSLNVEFGKANMDQLAAAVTRERPDVIVLLEMQTPTLRRLEATGAVADYPHRAGHTEPGWAELGYESGAGTLVLSRTPVTQLAALPTTLGSYVVRLDRPGTDVTLVAAHPLNMILGAERWTREGAVLRDAVRAHLAEPLVVAGDLNAVPEHVTFRDLLATGLTDGRAQAGAGWRPTFAANGLLPPLIQIDHVLTNAPVTCTGFRTFAVADTDHRGVVADLVVRG